MKNQMGMLKMEMPKMGMPKMGMLRPFIVICLAAFAFGCAEKPDVKNVYIVRHAEKDTGPAAGSDPNLSIEGKARAHALAELLFGENIAYIHSSDYMRTKNTAAPLALKAGLDVQIYSPSDLPALAADIKSKKGNHVVIGHSNTVIETALALGAEITAEEALPIDEATEYDRLYLVQITPENTSVSLHRYYDEAGEEK